MTEKNRRPEDEEPGLEFLNHADDWTEESAESCPSEIAESWGADDVRPEHSSPTPEHDDQTAAMDQDSRDSAGESLPLPAVSRPDTDRSVGNAASRANGISRPLTISTKMSSLVLGYAITSTLFFLFLLFTGRVSLSRVHVLESLPDVRPLAPNEFLRVPDGTPLPPEHAMKIGESRRFGDVVVTPLKVTREPLTFQGFLTGEPAVQLTTKPVLKLWLEFENAADDYGFPPFDARLMSHRSPPDAVDDTAVVNSFLTTNQNGGHEPGIRVLNFLQSLDSNFVITGQELSKVIMPGERSATFIASSEAVSELTAPAETEFTWRVQFRKGIHENSGNGVTTLIDVSFSGSEIANVAPAVGAPAG